MAEIYKILAQVAPAAGIGNYFATVPNSKAWVISTVVVCNTGAATTFRLNAVYAGNGAAYQYNTLYYDTAIAANTTLNITIGITLSNADQLYCYSAAGTLAFSVFGVQKDQTNVY